MKRNELNSWEIYPCSCAEVNNPEKSLEAALNSKGERFSAEKTLQVHDLLREKGHISPIVIETGSAADCQWVGESDWVYRTEFSAPAGKGPHYLHLLGLDTVCDLFLNREYLGTSRTMYLPFREEVTNKLKDRNELLIYFYQHEKMKDYYERTMPAEWKGNIPPRAMLRRRDDYGLRLEDKHGYRPIGIFDKVFLETAESAELANLDLEVSFPLTTLDLAVVKVALDGKSFDNSPLSVKLTIAEFDGSNAQKIETVIDPRGGVWELALEVPVQNPKLWWPRNYGEPNRYRAELEIFAGKTPVARESRFFGIRRLRKTGDMFFTVNDVPVRFWGGNFAPIWGPSTSFNKEYAIGLVEKTALAGVNAVRIWGPSQPYPEEFYDKFDELGIMVWQDFPTGGSQLPDSEEYRSLFCAEAEFMVKKLKHHPCIYLWCGGNENIYMCQFRGEKETHGFEILIDAFKDVCARLDPQRYYHATSPYGGRYTNDPMSGDSHGSRALRSFCAGESYGLFFSEDIRVYPPQYKSFYRWIGDAIWDDDYVDAKPFGCNRAMPKSWQYLMGNNGEKKLGPVWDYYAATNAKELVYKHTAAAGQDLYQMFARSRRGNPAHKSHEGQFCRGHVVWKINDTWPNFYCAMVDYYLEPSLPFYSIKRAIKPVWIDFEVGDHIYLWGVNDTREPAFGTLELTIYNLEFEEIRKKVSIPAALEPGTSRIIMDLDSFNFMSWFTLLHASFRDQKGAQIAVTNNYVTKENMLPFHDAKLELKRDGDWLTLRTDKFARCVELSAGEDGAAFGWVFEDNYFDLFPFEEKRVLIQRRGEGSVIQAKAQYSGHTAKVNL